MKEQKYFCAGIHCRNELIVNEENNCERCGAFFPQSFGTFQQRDIWETIDFFDVVYGTKKVCL